jgi:hypothetical protein
MKIKAQAPFYMKLKRQKVIDDIKNIVYDYDILSNDKKEFLVKLYIKSYEYGTKVVKKESFSDVKNTIYQDLQKRFDAYTDTGTNDIAFIKKIAEGDENTLTEMLKHTASQEDFIYETYQSNYIDRSMDVIHSINIPKGFEKIDVTLVSQDSFADGAMKKIDYLCREMLMLWAKDLLGDM